MESMSERNLRVGIIGASGYGGAELARLLATHARAELVAATASGERAGQKLSDLFPSLRGVCDIACEEFEADTFAAKCGLAFLALPHGKALTIVPQLLERGVKVIDLGADFRLRDVAEYQTWYKLEHSAPEILAQAIYGLPEWNRASIKSAKLVANPGCYPTSAILALAPFVDHAAIELNSIIVDAASGTSGAGRSSFGIGMHFPELHGDFKAYNVGAHRHTPEIEQGLRDAIKSIRPSDGSTVSGHPENGRTFAISFTAHLLPIARGILSTCYANLVNEMTAETAREILFHHYNNEPFVRVCNVDELPQIKHVAGSNFCDIGVKVDARTNRLIVVSAIDNLIKGAAGQAVQNMNLMSGFDETDGLKLAPLFP